MTQARTRGMMIAAVFVAFAFAQTSGIAGNPSAVMKQMIRPVLVRNEHNALLQLTIESQEPFVEIKSMTVSLTGAENLESLQMYFTGAESRLTSDMSFGDRRPSGATIVLKGHARLSAGANHFWLSCRVRPQADLTDTVDASVTAIETSVGRTVPRDATPDIRKRIGIALRRHWDDGVHTYRIPALATTPKGTLLVAYDMRRRARRDLQEDN